MPQHLSSIVASVFKRTLLFITILAIWKSSLSVANKTNQKGSLSHFNLLATAFSPPQNHSLRLSPKLAMSSTSTSTLEPPVPRREEDRVIYAGVAPKDWDAELPRQSNDSTEKLLDPVVPVKDPYGWMRNDKRDNQEVLDHLAKENEYTQACIKHLEPLQKELYDEFLSSIQETDYTTPRPRGHYWYYTRTFQGKSYQQYCRAPLTPKLTIEWDGRAESPILEGEEVYLDQNILGKDKSYCSLGAAKVSPSQKYLAYAVDFKGDEIYQVYIRDLATGDDVPLYNLGGEDEELLDTAGNVVWGPDDTSLFYMTMDETHRPDKLWLRQNWQDENPKERLLKEERDDIYWSHVSKSLDGKYVFF